MAYRKKTYTPRRRAYKRRASSRSYASYRSAPRRRTSRPRSQTKKCVCPPPQLDAGQKFALAQIDPFDPNAVGAKIPDSNTVPSIANCDTEMVTVNGPGTLGHLSAIACRPRYTWSHILPVPAGTINWGAAWSTHAVNRQKRTAYIDIMELDRPVAHAARISCPDAPTNTTGFVHIGLANESLYGASASEVTWTFPTTVAEMSGLRHYKRVTLASLTQTPITVINKWLDETAFRYSAPNSTLVEGANHTTFQTDGGWCTIIIMVEGARTGTVPISVEHTLMSESIPKTNGVIFGTPAARDSSNLMNAVGNVSVTVEPFHTEAEGPSYRERAVNALAQGAAQQGEQVFQSVAVPFLQQIGAFGTTTALNMAANALNGIGGIQGVNSNANRLTA